MSVVMVGSPHVACGIATYSANLSLALRAKGVAIHIADSLADVEEFLDNCDQYPQILHVQHETGLYEEPQLLIAYLTKYRDLGIQTVVTVHTEEQDLIELLAATADAVILHNDLFNLSLSNRTVTRIPHGIPVLEDLPDVKICRNKYEIPCESFVIGTTGFMHDPWMIRLVLKNLALFVAQHSDVFLNLIISSRSTDFEGMKARQLRAEILSVAEAQGFSDRIWVGDSFLEDPEYHERINTLDLGFSMGDAGWPSASGSVTEMLACGIPVVVNDITHFRAVRSACYCVATMEDIGPAIVDLYEHWDEAAGSLRQKMIEIQKEQGYPSVAEAHLNLYSALTQLG